MIPDFVFPEFETSRLKVCCYNPAFLKDAFDIYSDAETMRMAGPSMHTGIKETEDFINSAIKSSREGSFLFWGIVYKETGKLIGDISLHPDYKHKYATLGSILYKSFFQKGLMTEASWPVISYAFNELGLNRAEAQICTEHLASIKYVEKLGFRNEGRLRQNFFIDGKLYDSYMYAVIKEDFKFLK